MIWPSKPVGRLRDEAHFGDRIVRCFADRPAHVDAMLKRSVEAGPDREALVCGPVRWTYAQIDAAVEAVAANLWNRFRTRPGDRIALYGGNAPESVLVFLAGARIGAIVIPLSERLRRAELQYMLSDSGARILIFEAGLAEHIPDTGRTPGIEHRIAFGEGSSGAVSFDLLREPGTVPHPPIAEEEIAFILYTSGTTGRPKGALLTHINVVHSAMHYRVCMGLTAADRSLMAVPVAHVTGLIAQLLTMVHAGGATVMMRSFKADLALAAITEERITHAVLVPAMYELMLRHPDFATADLGSLRIGAFGGAPMPQATIAALRECVPNLTLMNAYGATETTSPATLLPPGAIETRPGSVGRAVHCADIRIMDEHHCEVPAGQSGEIWIGGPMVVPGYWKNADATADSFTAGYWHSGDVGRIDEDGYLEVLDRTKDMINRGGYKIYSAEVENVMTQHVDVVECAVVAKPCPVLGERVHAFVVLTGTGTGDKELKGFCAERLADYKVPETFTRVEGALQRNANGKVMKDRLRAELEQADAKA